MFRKSIRLAAVMALPASAMVGGAPAWAQTPFDLNMFCKLGHAEGGQQPRVPFETRTTVGNSTTLLTANGYSVFPEGDSFGTNPPNMLPTIYENAKTCRGNEIPNTLPSTPENPYNLHDDPVIRAIDKTSPTDDLDWIMDRLEAISEPQEICRNFRGTEHCYSYPRRVDPSEMRTLARRAVDIIEGNELKGRFSEREYEGFPILHYLGGLKIDPDSKEIRLRARK